MARARASAIRLCWKMASSSSESLSEKQLVSKPRAMSVAWRYFGLIADDHGVPVPEENKPVCRTCERAVSAKGGNTTNLLSHLKEHHPTLYTEAMTLMAEQSSTSSKRKRSSTSAEKPKSQQTIVQAVEAAKKFSPRSPQAVGFNRAVAYYLVKDLQPFVTVEKPGFRQLVEKLNPKYDLPSRKHFAEHEIPLLYNDVKEKRVLPSLKQANFFSVTTDMWSSRVNHPFMSFTVHFVQDWSLTSFCLDTVPLFEDHTGQNICDAFQDILDNWKLDPRKLVATTTDNGANYVAAFQILDWMRVSCFGHNLNLAISKAIGIASVQRAISRCHSLVEMFNRSTR